MPQPSVAGSPREHNLPGGTDGVTLTLVKRMTLVNDALQKRNFKKVKNSLLIIRLGLIFCVKRKRILSSMFYIRKVISL